MTVLQEFGIDKALNNSYQQLIAQKPDSGGLQLFESVTTRSIIATTFDQINQAIGPIPDPERKHEVKSITAEVTTRLFLHWIREIEVELRAAARIFDEVIKAACTIFGHDYDDYRDHFNLDQIVALSEELSGTSIAKKQRKTRKNSLAWQVKHEALAELVDQIRKKRDWVRRPARIFKLFENPPDSLEIIWNCERLEELAHLIYRLHQEGLIACFGNRGFFSAVERHVQGFEGEKIKPGTLKKLRHRINKDSTRFQHKTKKVEAIIQAVIEKARN